MRKLIQNKTRAIPYVALTAGTLSIGLSAIFVRSADAPGVISSFYRMGIGAVLMAIPFSYQIRRKRNEMPLKGIKFGILGGFFFSLDMVFWSTGIMISGATVPTLLVNTAPLWVGLGSWLLLREKQNRMFWLGLVIAIFGSSLVLGLDMSRSHEFGLGAWYGMLSAFFYGAYHLVSQRGREYLNTLSYFWISTTVSALFLLLYAFFLRAPLAGYDHQTWLLFILMGIFVQVIGWMFINYAHGHIAAAIVSPTLLAQPIITAMFAIVFLGERLTNLHLLGGSFVIGGVFLVHRSRSLSS